MSSHATPPRSSGSFYRKLPVWLQWVIPFTIAGAFLAVLVLWVHHKTDDTPSEASVTNPQAIVEQNREAKVLASQLQAPHVAVLANGAAAAPAIHAAVLGYMHRQVKTSVIPGPITRSTCTSVPSSTTAGRVAFKCSVIAASVSYPFFGVVDTSQQQVIFCRFVPAPVSGENIPVSKRCT